MTSAPYVPISAKPAAPSAASIKQNIVSDAPKRAITVLKSAGKWPERPVGKPRPYAARVPRPRRIYVAAFLHSIEAAEDDASAAGLIPLWLSEVPGYY